MMRNMKTVWLALLLCLALSLSLFVVACNNDNGEDPVNDPDAGQNEQPGENNNQQPVDPDDGKQDEPTQPEKVTYTVTIKDQDGNPIAGVEAQICVDGLCKKPNVTDENGMISFSMDDPGESTLSLQINADPSPEGYEYPTDKIAIEAGQTEISVTLNKLAQ